MLAFSCLLTHSFSKCMTFSMCSPKQKKFVCGIAWNNVNIYFFLFFTWLESRWDCQFFLIHCNCVIFILCFCDAITKSCVLLWNNYISLFLYLYLNFWMVWCQKKMFSHSYTCLNEYQQVFNINISILNQLKGNSTLFYISQLLFFC